MTTGIGGLISSLSFGALITETIKLADKYTLLDGRVKLVSKTSKEFEKAQENLFKIAQNTRIGYAKTLEVYARFARATEELGTSQDDLARLTDIVNKSIKISGATATEADAALIQFSQGIAAGALRGQELNSVMEQTPAIANAIADGMGIARTEIRKMAAEGKLTAEVVVKALLKQGKAIDEEFSKMPLTIADAWTKITNTVGKAINETNKHVNATENLAKMLDSLNSILEKVTDNMERYLDVTLSGLKAIAKIAAAGGAMWVLPLVITRIHKAAVLANFIFFKWQAGALKLNTALYGTSVSARLANKSLSKMHLLGQGLMAFFVGWELGKWANENFEEVRMAGLAAVAGLTEQWIKFKFGLQQLWIDLKFGYLEMVGSIDVATGEVIQGIADKFAGLSFTVKNPFGDDFVIGLDAASDKLSEVANRLKESGDVTGEHQEAVATLNEEYTKAIGIHKRTVDIIIEQRDWEKKAAETHEESADQFIEKEIEKSEAIKELSDEQKGIREDLTEKIHELENTEFDHKMWLLDQEVAKMVEVAGKDKLIQDQVALYHKLKQEEITKNFKKNESLRLKDFINTKEIMTDVNRSLVEAIIRGENTKVAVAKVAQDKLTDFSVRAATEGLSQIISGIAEQIGAWISLGAAQGLTIGESVKAKLASGAVYIAGAATAVMAAKAVSNNFAEGGWIDSHPHGGILRGGSGYKDDVFLKYTDGGSTINMGMGGEYVMDKKTTQANLPLLEWMRGKEKRVFAQGGGLFGDEGSLPTGAPPGWPSDAPWPPIIDTGDVGGLFGGGRKPKDWKDREGPGISTKGAVNEEAIWNTAEEINNSGFSTFVTSLFSSGFNWYKAVIDSIIYYGGVGLGTIAGKEVGKNLYSDGGQVEVKEYSDGGILGDIAGTILDVLGWDVGDIWDYLRSFDFIGDFVKLADTLIFPFVRDAATPGVTPGFESILEGLKNSFDDLLDLVVDALQDLLEDTIDPFDIFHSGTSFVPATGPAIVERGERILSAGDNKEVMAILRSGGNGGRITIESKPSIKVMIGNKELKNFILDITDDYDVKKSRRSVTGRTRYGTTS
jgi:tape measure domain-containing protein